MTKLLALLGAITITAVCWAATPAAEDDTATAIKAVLNAQLECWNSGDLDGFMEGYWNSPELTFSSGGATRRGYAETIARYRKTYPTPEKMGRTEFSELEVTPLGDSAALVLGRWALSREEDPIGGNFTLVFREINGRWLIIHDHTSKDESATGNE